ncbi:MAG: hypothetical protein Athens101410_702 [Parcubacteria group bacterium Athens1014_10]|nr:MAG: hypothetical protein Athens101410_702 [Parcubacteria group bacterium Athens1014_10]TSD04687.1 MAG: hypothetical protein Athens071412_682 [Parcubacteria group bacterium Athens0714_12]
MKQFNNFLFAEVVKLANTRGSEPRAARLVGSSPTFGTILRPRRFIPRATDGKPSY